MANRFASSLTAGLPSQVTAAMPPGLLSELSSNPQALVDPQAMAALNEQFSELGPAGAELVQELVEVLRDALASAISDVFIIGLVAVAVAFVATLFLREVPLRRSHSDNE